MAFVPENPPHGESAPLKRYLRSQFDAVAREIVTDDGGDTGLDKYVAKGYGGIRLQDPTPLSNIGASWQEVPFDRASLDNPFDVTQDFANNGLRINRPGIWFGALNFTFEHNSGNSGRYVGVRLRNKTANTTIKEWQFGTGRNVEFTSIALTWLNETNVDEGDIVVPQVGNGSVYTDVVMWNAEFSVHHVSELQEGTA